MPTPDRVIVHRETIRANAWKGKPARDVEVVVEIHVSAIARQLGSRAANNTTRKAIEIGGLVTVKAGK